MASLMKAVALGRDVEAFETLFRYFAPRVKAYMTHLGSGAAQPAEELMQETMITVWNKAGQYDASKAAVSTWIFTIARNQRIDAFRRENRPVFDPKDPAFVPDEVAPADAAYEAMQSSQQLHLAIAGLPDDQAALLRRAFFDGDSHSEIASGLGLPLGTVKSRLRLAFDKLRIALAGDR
ncbi:sigma-70 family RNA polymerase sigma factor [Mesorhizobium sp. NBSH29]|nr:sigma-70 family RNA polymerase sigma factor [Mesorhizobium sp. NBSH29]